MSYDIIPRSHQTLYSSKHVLIFTYSPGPHPTLYGAFQNKDISKTIYGEDGTASPFARNNCVVSPPCGAHGKQ